MDFPHGLSLVVALDWGWGWIGNYAIHTTLHLNGLTSSQRLGAITWWGRGVGWSQAGRRGHWKWVVRIDKDRPQHLHYTNRLG